MSDILSNTPTAETLKKHCIKTLPAGKYPSVVWVDLVRFINTAEVWYIIVFYIACEIYHLRKVFENKNVIKVSSK